MYISGEKFGFVPKNFPGRIAFTENVSYPTLLVWEKPKECTEYMAVFEQIVFKYVRSWSRYTWWSLRRYLYANAKNNASAFLHLTKTENCMAPKIFVGKIW